MTVLVKLDKCACGCGNAVAPGRRFVQWHHIRVQSPETRAKLSAARKGKSLSSAHRTKLSLSKIGPLNPQWKGEDASYYSLHEWVLRWKAKTGQCTTCSFEGDTEWANISGLYFRDLEDFAELCRSCHNEFDSMEMG